VPEPVGQELPGCCRYDEDKAQILPMLAEADVLKDTVVAICGVIAF